ncbi:hypothetical protein T484DRAFT_1755432 [Baffinella frigidus]|nr:hypothetical protein T484DRAFT_1755432 [Cryptophyta sp. CCMP2293]
MPWRQMIFPTAQDGLNMPWAAVCASHNAEIARVQDLPIIAFDKQEQLLLDSLLQAESHQQAATHMPESAHGREFQSDFADLEIKLTSTRTCIDIDATPWQNPAFPELHAHPGDFDLYDDYTIDEWTNHMPDEPRVCPWD